MKTTRNAILFPCTVFIIFILSVLTGCDKPVSPDISESERVAALLNSGTWKINNVTVDGITDGSFAAMTVVFTKTEYAATYGSVVWPTSGTWNFTNDSGKVIRRDDGIEVTINTISETSLTLSLIWSKTTLGGGREKSVQGEHVFTFNK